MVSQHAATLIQCGYFPPFPKLSRWGARCPFPHLYCIYSARPSARARSRHDTYLLRTSIARARPRNAVVHAPACDSGVWYECIAQRLRRAPGRGGRVHLLGAATGQLALFHSGACEPPTACVWLVFWLCARTYTSTASCRLTASRFTLCHLRRLSLPAA